MLDLTGLDLNVETAQTIDGVGAKLANAEALNTPIVVHGIVNNGTPVSPAPIVATGAVVLLGTTTLTFDGDAVTVTAASSTLSQSLEEVATNA